MTKNKLTNKDLVEIINPSNLMNHLEVESENGKTIYYTARVHIKNYSINELMGKVYIESSYDDVVTEKKTWKNNKPKSRIVRTRKWLIRAGDNNEGVLLLNESGPVNISDRELNYKNILISEGLQTHNYSDDSPDFGPTLLKPKLIEELFAPIDKQLLEIYKTIENKNE